MDRKKIVWSVISVVIAAFSIWAVVSRCQSFSFAEFLNFITGASPLYLILAVCSMLIFIVAEAKALNCITKSFGYRSKTLDRLSYSASDIYFSAITPSATGGQPACAFFMIKDGIPGSTSAVALLANLIMYTLSIIVIGVIAVCINPSLFFSFSAFSKFLIIAGTLVNFALLFFFVMLLYREEITRKIVISLISFGAFLHIIRHKTKMIDKASHWMDDFRDKAAMLKGHTSMLCKVFLWNLFQRAGVILVTVFTYLATCPPELRTLSYAIRTFSIQSLVVLGANFIPVPGAMGVTDYLMLDGFDAIMTEEMATSLELLSRSLSFYVCIIICGFIVVAKLISLKRRKIK